MRARRPRELWVRALVLFLILLTGCRDENPAEGGTDTDAFVVRMLPGTRMRFDHWLLDRLGARIIDSRTTRIWTVVAEDVEAYGFNDAVLVIDSITGGRVDTLFFRFSPPGDVYAYGYLAQLIQRREGREIPPGWDRIAAFSLLPPVTWSVGFTDSTQTLRAVGETTGEVLFFEVVLDGVRTAIPAREADISKSNLLASLWLASTPSVAVRLREDVLTSSAQVAGELSELVSVTTPPS